MQQRVDTALLQGPTKLNKRAVSLSSLESSSPLKEHLLCRPPSVCIAPPTVRFPE
jgi:hypothetical protein